jgi:2-keto-4-pentenoate hydratase/2-oxohepta-3-ene-1,7-dioic acid hydratase in catechol pathway
MTYIAFPPPALKRGDRIEGGIEGLEVLRNTIAA